MKNTNSKIEQRFDDAMSSLSSSKYMAELNGCTKENKHENINFGGVKVWCEQNLTGC